MIERKLGDSGQNVERRGGSNEEPDTSHHVNNTYPLKIILPFTFVVHLSCHFGVSSCLKSVDHLNLTQISNQREKDGFKESIGTKRTVVAG